VNEASHPDLADVKWDLGRFGKLHVRKGKGARGSGPASGWCRRDCAHGRGGPRRRSRRMTLRSWVIRAVPTAIGSRAPAMAASNRATARDTLAWAPRKLICTARVFWMMKISITMSTAQPAISALRALLIRVRSRGRRLAAAGGDGAVPLADGGGGALSVLGSGAVGSAMTVASFRDRR
jgi:hypothetical protein